MDLGFYSKSEWEGEWRGSGIVKINPIVDQKLRTVEEQANHAILTLQPRRTETNGAAIDHNVLLFEKLANAVKYYRIIRADHTVVKYKEVMREVVYNPNDHERKFLASEPVVELWLFVSEFGTKEEKNNYRALKERILGIETRLARVPDDDLVKVPRHLDLRIEDDIVGRGGTVVGSQHPPPPPPPPPTEPVPPPPSDGDTTDIVRSMINRFEPFEQRALTYDEHLDNVKTYIDAALRKYASSSGNLLDGQGRFLYVVAWCLEGGAYTMLFTLSDLLLDALERCEGDTALIAKNEKVRALCAYLRSIDVSFNDPTREKEYYDTYTTSDCLHSGVKNWRFFDKAVRFIAEVIYAGSRYYVSNELLLLKALSPSNIPLVPSDWTRYALFALARRVVKLCGQDLEDSHWNRLIEHHRQKSLPKGAPEEPDETEDRILASILSPITPLDVPNFVEEDEPAIEKVIESRNRYLGPFPEPRMTAGLGIHTRLNCFHESKLDTMQLIVYTYLSRCVNGITRSRSGDAPTDLRGKTIDLKSYMKVDLKDPDGNIIYVSVKRDRLGDLLNAMAAGKKTDLFNQLFLVPLLAGDTDERLVSIESSVKSQLLDDVELDVSGYLLPWGGVSMPFSSTPFNADLMTACSPVFAFREGKTNTESPFRGVRECDFDFWYRLVSKGREQKEDDVYFVNGRLCNIRQAMMTEKLFVPTQFKTVFSSRSYTHENPLCYFGSGYEYARSLMTSGQPPKVNRRERREKEEGSAEDIYAIVVSCYERVLRMLNPRTIWGALERWLGWKCEGRDKAHILLFIIHPSIFETLPQARNLLLGAYYGLGHDELASLAGELIQAMMITGVVAEDDGAHGEDMVGGEGMSSEDADMFGDYHEDAVGEGPMAGVDGDYADGDYGDYADRHYADGNYVDGDYADGDYVDGFDLVDDGVGVGGGIRTGDE